MRRLLLLVALLVPGPLWAQLTDTISVNKPPTRGWAFSVGMLPLIAQGYEVNVEKRWRAGSRHSVTLTPQWYQGQVGTLTSELHQHDADEVRGYGVAAQHRIYLSPQPTFPDGVYVGYGASYQHFQMQFQAAGWQQEPGPDGLSYYQYGVRGQTETIDRYGAAVVAGRQMRFPDSAVFFDAYLGLGFRLANSRTTLPGNFFASGMSDYGHEGVYIPVGIRVGIVL